MTEAPYCLSAHLCTTSQSPEPLDKTATTSLKKAHHKIVQNHNYTMQNAKGIASLERGMDTSNNQALNASPIKRYVNTCSLLPW